MSIVQFSKKSNYSADDRNWFKQHPDREYRVRRTHGHRDVLQAADNDLSIIDRNLHQIVVGAAEYQHGAVVDTDCYARMRLAHLEYIKAKMAHEADAPARLRGVAA
jgi:hypothetical protein